MYLQHAAMYMKRLMLQAEVEAVIILNELVGKMQAEGTFEVAFWLNEMNEAIKQENSLQAKIVHQALMRECRLSLCILSEQGWKNVRVALVAVDEHGKPITERAIPGQVL